MARRGRGWQKAPVRLEPQAALTAAGTALYAWDLGTDEIAWGPNAAEVLGIPHAGVFPDGASYAAAVEPQGGESRAEAITAGGRPADGGVPYRVRYALRTRADRLVMVEDTGRWFADAEGRPALARGTLRVDQGSGSEDGLAAGLRARSGLLAQIADEVAEAQRSRHSLTLVVGHVTAEDGDPDEALAGLAGALRPLMRRRDRFVPYGPGRFALALASCTAADAPQAVERLLALAGADGLAQGLRLGAASAPDHAFDAPTLLRHAEEALASEAGRFAVYAPVETGPSAPPAGTPAFDIVDALNARTLVAAHRPVRDAGTREPVFHTVVPRIGHEAPGAMAQDLSAAAERAGLSLLLDTRLLELAADFLALRLLHRVVLPIATATLYDPEWLYSLAAHLGARPGIESRLIIEIPETALRDGATRGRLNAMKALGVGIMISGFGSGHTELKDLRQIPVDILKISGALIGNLGRGTEDRLLVHRLVDLAHHLGLATVAEWVADEASAHLLADWGVDYLEGPLCGAAALPVEAGERRQALAG
ncbi:MAG TPA: GGDEF domain-containing protein [Microvirga sp.]|nr:GGDEF domain-containing protein [Microvirga sp.]